MLRTITNACLRTALAGIALAIACISVSFAGEGGSTFARLQFGNDVSIEVPRNQRGQGRINPFDSVM